MSITPGPKAGRTRELAELRNRAHNDADVLSLGQRLVPAEDLIDG